MYRTAYAARRALLLGTASRRALAIALAGGFPPQFFVLVRSSNNETAHAA